MSNKSLQSSPQVTNQQTLSSSSSNIFDDNSQEKLLQENFKLSLKLQELEKQLFKEKSLQQFNSQNNTSATFELPSEFKAKWDNFVQDLLMDAYGDFFHDMKLIIPLVQFSIISTNSVIEMVMNSKLKTVLEVFNLKQDDKTQVELQNLLKPFLQNNYKEIFKDHTLFEAFYARYLQDIQKSMFYTDQEMSGLLDSLASNKGALKEYFESLKNILVYMKINDPPIMLEPIPLPKNSTQISQIKLHKFYQDSFYVIDGFDKEGKPCFIVLNQPKICNGSFAGIKPSVIILEKLPQDILYSDIIDSKIHLKCSFEDIIPDQKPSNLQTYNFKVQRNIIYTTLSEFPNSLKNPRTESLPEIKLADQNSSKESDKDEEEEEGFLDRDFNQTSSDILTYLNDEKVLRNRKSPQNSDTLNVVDQKTPPHRNLSQTNIANLQKSAQIKSSIQLSMFKRRQTQVIKDQRQRVNDNLALIDKSCNGSRYLQCSRYFLKSVVSQAEHRKQLRELSQQQQQIQHSRNSSRQDFNQEELLNLINKTKFRDDGSQTISIGTLKLRGQTASQQQLRKEQMKSLNSTLEYRQNQNQGQSSNRVQRQKSPIQDKIIKQGSVLNRVQSSQRIPNKKQKNEAVQQPQWSTARFNGTKIAKLTSPKAVIVSSFTPIKQAK